MVEFRFSADSEADTQRLAAALADVVPDGSTLALVGTLGAGKTRLVQFIAEQCGIDPSGVVSPTFVLCQPYLGRRQLYHLDAYRLRDEDEFLELGPEEMFESPAITLIEWADRVAGCLPWEYLEIRIEVTGPDARRFLLIPYGERFEKVLEELEKQLQRPQAARNDREAGM